MVEDHDEWELYKYWKKISKGMERPQELGTFSKYRVVLGKENGREPVSAGPRDDSVVFYYK